MKVAEVEVECSAYTQGELDFMHVSNLLPQSECAHIRNLYTKVAGGGAEPLPAHLLDSDDQCNVVYRGGRSPLEYVYLSAHGIDAIHHVVRLRLQRLTRMSWLSCHCLPVFIYREGGYIKPHRDRDIGLGTVKYVAIAMVTPPDNYTGGRFFLNCDATASPDGKTVEENVDGRHYFELDVGDAVVFCNEKYIHGTELVGPAEGGIAGRITASWRT